MLFCGYKVHQDKSPKHRSGTLGDQVIWHNLTNECLSNILGKNDERIEQYNYSKLSSEIQTAATFCSVIGLSTFTGYIKETNFVSKLIPDVILLIFFFLFILLLQLAASAKRFDEPRQFSFASAATTYYLARNSNGP